MFAESTLLDKLKSFDVYRKLPSDYLQPTYSGAACNFLLIIDKNNYY